MEASTGKILNTEDIPGSKVVKIDDAMSTSYYILKPNQLDPYLCQQLNDTPTMNYLEGGFCHHQPNDDSILD